MEQTKNGSHKHPTEKSRATMRRELEELQTLLQQRETELATCQENLAQAAGDVQQLKEDLTEKARQLEVAHKEIGELQTQAKQHEKNIELLNAQNQQLRGENEELQKGMIAEKEKAVKFAEEARTEQQKAEPVRRDLEQKLRELEKKQSAFKGKVLQTEPSQAAETSAIPTPTATFRIDLYPRDGHYVGKIEHILSQDKKPLKGLDQTTIMEFIKSHLPSSSEKVDTEITEQTVFDPNSQICKDDVNPEQVKPVHLLLGTFYQQGKQWEINVGPYELYLKVGQKEITLLDQKAIKKLLTAYLPRIVEKMDQEMSEPALPTTEAQISKAEAPAPACVQPIQPPIDTTACPSVLREVTVRQGHHLIQKKPPVVKQGVPFFVNVQLHLPAAPQKKMEIPFSSYSVRLMAQMAQSMNPVAEKVEADDLSPQKADYEKIIAMPALNPGSYILHAYTLVPFAHVAEHKKMELTVA